MALVGEAHIIVRAMTDRVRDDIRRGFSGVDNVVEAEGRKANEAFNRGFNRGGGGGRLFSRKFEADAERARQKLQGLIAVGNLLGPALAGAAGAIGSLGGGLFSLAAGVASAVPSLVVLPGILLSVAQAAITLKLAFGGIGAAFSAGLRAQGGGGSSGGSVGQQALDNAKQIKAALRQIADARRALQQVIKENVQRRLEALEAVRDAEEQVEEAVWSASEAQRDYIDAQIDTKDAMDDLSRARQEAIEDLQQLRFETEGAAISEKKARLEFDEAREALARVQDLPPNNRARQEAEIAFAEAELNLRRAIDKNQDLQKEESDATKAGVDGSKKVIDAQRRLLEAQRAETNALRNLTKANQEVVKARIDLAEATRNVSAVEQENTERQREAIRNLKDAYADLAEARKKITAGGGGGGGGGGLDPFAQAMSKLSKEAQDFVRFLLKIYPEFKKLQASAGKLLFPKLQIAIQELVDKLFPKLNPLLETTGGKIGDVAIKIAKTITEARNLKSLERIWQTGDYLITAFGDAASDLIVVFLRVMEAADDLIIRFADWVTETTAAWRATAEGAGFVDRLRESFNKAGDVAAQLGRIFKDTFGGIFELFKAATGPGSGAEFLLDFFEKGAAKFREFATIGNSNGSLKQFFYDSSVNASKLLQLIGDIVKVVLKLGASQNLGALLETLRDAIPPIENIIKNLDAASPKLGELIVMIAKLAEAITSSGAIQYFYDTLLLIAKVMLAIVQNPIVQTMLKLVGAILGVAAALGLATKAFNLLFKATAGNIIQARKNLITLGDAVGGIGTKGKHAKGAMDDIDASAGKATKGVKGLGMAMKGAFLSNPVGLAITAITTALTGFWMAQQAADQAAQDFADTLDKVTGAATEATYALAAEKLFGDVTELEEWQRVAELTGISVADITAAVVAGGPELTAFQERWDAAANSIRTSTDKAFTADDKALIQAVGNTISSTADDMAYGAEKAAVQRAANEAGAIAAKKLGDATEDTKSALKDQTDAYKAQNAVTLRYNALAEEAAEVTDSVKQSFNELLDTFDSSRAQDSLKETAKSVKQTIKGMDLDLTSSKGMKNFRENFRDAAEKVVQDAITIGGTPKQIEDNIRTGMAAVKTTFIEKGKVNKDDVKAMTEELGLLPKQIKDRVQTAADKVKGNAKESMTPVGSNIAYGIGGGVSAKSTYLINIGKQAIRNVKQGAEQEAVIKSPSKLIAEIGTFLVLGLSSGIENTSDKAVKQFVKIITDMTKGGDSALKELGEKAKARFEEFVSDITLVGEAVADLKKGFKEALAPPENPDLTPLEKAKDIIAETEKRLIGIQEKLGKDGVLKNKEGVIAGFTAISANLKENLIVALQQAQAEYDEVKGRFLTFKDSIVSALTGSLDLSSAIQSAKEGGGSVVDALNAQAQKARDFNDRINKLIEAKFSPETIQRVVSAGAVAGTEIADGLLKGGQAAVAADQTLQAELKALAEKTATLAYDTYFKAGEDTALAQVNGIKELMNGQTKEGSILMKTMKRLAKKLGQDVTINVRLSRDKFDVVINTVRRSVSSPSVRTGAQVGPEGAGATGGIVTRPTYALIGEAGPEAVIPLNQTPGNRPLPAGMGFGEMTINVYPSAGMDEAELAAMISRQLAFQMRKGSL